MDFEDLESENCISFCLNDPDLLLCNTGFAFSLKNSKSFKNFIICNLKEDFMITIGVWLNVEMLYML